MRTVAYAPLAVAVSKAGGLGFIGAGNDVSDLEKHFDESRKLLSELPTPLKTARDTLPIGVGLLLWGAPLKETMSIISKPHNRPAAVWLFAPWEPADLATWTREIRQATDGATQVWIQVGTVAEAVAAVEIAEPDVLVVQGSDAGGHGLTKGAGLIPLLPETIETVTKAAEQKNKVTPLFVATGAIMTGSCFAATLAMGAHGATLGTRYLAAKEATISAGYQNAVLRAKDGGVTTVRSHVYDALRGTTQWPGQYGGRGVINASYEDFEKGMDMEQNKRLYDEAMKQGDEGWQEDSGRLTTYAGTGVGLVNKVQPAGEITTEVREEAVNILRTVSESLSSL